MPPRRSARVAAVTELAEGGVFARLPLPLALHIYSLLPADARARAACVCRGWCAALSELILWTRLDLSPSSGVRVVVTDAVLAVAARKARGQLAALNVFDCDRLTFDAVLAVVRANAGALRELRAGTLEHGTELILGAGRVEQLSLAAPQLTALHADVRSVHDVAAARHMLRNEPPFQLLRLRALGVNLLEGGIDEMPALMADVATHASLRRVELVSASLHTLVALDVVVDAALSLGLANLCLYGCRLSPASVPALVRLLGGRSLTELRVDQFRQRMLDAPAAQMLGDVLRANTTLTSLTLHSGVFYDAGAAAALLGALVGHASVRTLKLGWNVLEHAPAVGAALGALVAANAPALTELEASRSDLGDAGLRPLFQALPHNTHLRALNVLDNDMTEAFARDELLPAVRANASLRKLHAAWPPQAADASVHEAQALVAARAAAA
jgi:hypothetical protein